MSFSQSIAENKFTLIAEIDPPKGTHLETFLEQARVLKSRVDALAVTDSEHAVMRMSPIAPCLKLISENIEPIMITNARDKNRISLQAEMLSAWTLGIKTIVCKMGIDPDWGDQPMVKSSGDLDTMKMVSCATSLNAGKDLAGEMLDGNTDFNIGVSIDPSDDIKINKFLAGSLTDFAELGVSFVFLGPTYDKHIVELFSEKAETTRIKLFTSLMLLKSVAMIRYLDNLPGIPAIPHEFLKIMMDAPIKSEAGLEIAAGYFKDIRQYCNGVVIQSLGWGNHLSHFLDDIGR